MNFFVTVYYLIAVFFIIWSLPAFGRPLKAAEKLIKGRKIAKEKFTHWKDIPEGNKWFYWQVVKTVFFLIWVIVGVFTFQWVVFLTYFIWWVIILGAITRHIKNKYILAVFQFIYAFTGIVFAFFVILNKYHLKIDFHDQVINILNLF